MEERPEGMLQRPRRNRLNEGIRRLVREVDLGPRNLIQPVFIHNGEEPRIPIASMPGIARLSVEEAVREGQRLQEAGIPAMALFPVVEEKLKDERGNEALNEEGLLPRALRALREACPDLVLFTDVALDPYSSDGHDGFVRDGEIVNDETVEILARMAVVQARAGAQVVAPSDMMDGRVGGIRRALDEAGFSNTLICSYCCKYASAFYGPFRDALDSAPRSGDKKTYQMDPANGREALRELALDEAEGADWILVKPGLAYLDVLARVRAATHLPVAAYHVSGEYAMLCAAAEQGWIDYDACLLETLLCFRRAGADMILTYSALDAARLLADGRLH